ncbi:hypothetical protein JCM8547_004572 [Rhodosporidiobolus lusitaniae]
MAIILSAAQCVRAASAYRALLRAQRITFKGDDFALKAAHAQTRIIFNRFIPSASASVSPFSADPSLPPAPDLKPKEGELTSEEVDEHIAGALEIAQYLRTNVVQGVKTADGNYALRIHKDTERGDNDTIKVAKASRAAGGARRRGRRNGAAGEEGAAPVGCCGGAGMAA